MPVVKMQMKLVLAEKPSVAQSIAKVLGAAKREDQSIGNCWNLSSFYSLCLGICIRETRNIRIQIGFVLINNKSARFVPLNVLSEFSSNTICQNTLR